MSSSTAYELGKSSWPSQILLVWCLGKGFTLPETQTVHCTCTALPTLNWIRSKMSKRSRKPSLKFRENLEAEEDLLLQKRYLGA